jgi:hypothetical protein
MRAALITLGLCCLVVSVHADGRNLEIRWKGWRIETGEPFAKDTASRIEHPLTYLVDGDPNTAWMFHGRPKAERGWNPYFVEFLRPSEPGQAQEKGSPVAVDELWLMNGFNKSRELFLRNNRVVEVKLWVNWKPVKAVSVSDEMGWHKIAIPNGGKGVVRLKLEFTRQARGTDNDLCLSELALYNKGRKLDFRLPPYVVYAGNSGGCCCGGMGNAYRFMTRAGRLEAPRFGAHEWSPGGRFLASVSEAPRRFEVHAWDTHTARAIYSHTLKRDPRHDWGWTVGWQGDRLVKAVCRAADGSGVALKPVTLKVR